MIYTPLTRCNQSFLLIASILLAIVGKILSSFSMVFDLASSLAILDSSSSIPLDFVASHQTILASVARTIAARPIGTSVLPSRILLFWDAK